MLEAASGAGTAARRAFGTTITGVEVLVGCGPTSAEGQESGGIREYAGETTLPGTGELHDPLLAAAEPAVTRRETEFRFSAARRSLAVLAAARLAFPPPPCLADVAMAEPRDFPFDAARDLLGLMRAMWRAEKRRSFPSARKLKALERFARELQEAQRIAATHDPGTAPYQKALAAADGVARRLADVVDVTDPVMPVLEAAGRRVQRRARATRRAPLDWAVGARRRGGG